jgi:hypothetical protein
MIEPLCEASGAIPTPPPRTKSLETEGFMYSPGQRRTSWRKFKNFVESGTPSRKTLWKVASLVEWDLDSTTPLSPRDSKIGSLLLDFPPHPSVSGLLTRLFTAKVASFHTPVPTATPRENLPYDHPASLKRPVLSDDKSAEAAFLQEEINRENSTAASVASGTYMVWLWRTKTT